MNSPRRTQLTRISMEESIIACRLYLAERKAHMSFVKSEFKSSQSNLDKKLPDKQESLSKPYYYLQDDQYFSSHATNKGKVFLHDTNHVCQLSDHIVEKSTDLPAGVRPNSC